MNQKSEKAYMAMYTLLNRIYSRHPYGNLAVVLGDLNPNTFADKVSADPAAWEDFCECYQNADGAYSTELDTAYYACKQFLQKYEDEWGYSIPYVLEEFRAEEYRACYLANENK